MLPCGLRVLFWGKARLTSSLCWGGALKGDLDVQVCVNNVADITFMMSSRGMACNLHSHCRSPFGSSEPSWRRRSLPAYMSLAAIIYRAVSRPVPQRGSGAAGRPIGRSDFLAQEHLFEHDPLRCRMRDVDESAAVNALKSMTGGARCVIAEQPLQRLKVLVVVADCRSASAATHAVLSASPL